MTSSMTTHRRRRRRRNRLSPEERQRRSRDRRFRTTIRALFVAAGFEQIRSRDQPIDVAGRTGDLDGVYVSDNVLVVVEDTTSASTSIRDHLRGKAEYFRHLTLERASLVAALESTLPQFAEYLHRHQDIDRNEFVVRFVYCSLFDVPAEYRKRYAPDCCFLSYSTLQYFRSLSRTIRRSARFEMFKFLDVELSAIGPSRSGTEVTTYHALLLPDLPSGFPSGHRLVSFLMDPETLLERSYVLRSDSWRDQDALYQRLLIRGKIASMREYLVNEHRVFINNIIVTLPSDATITLEGKGAAAALSGRITPVELMLPRRFNGIGIVDGQHRVFAYHEGDDKYETEIAKLRRRQHLLVTGIIYPAAMSRERAQKFEAKLFLEINDKQKRVRGDLKQSIERLVEPYSPVAVAKAVIEQMAVDGPLSDLLGIHFFDTGKIKTTSIVSYGLRHLVAIDGESSLFGEWRGPGKRAVMRHEDHDGLRQYVRFCASRLNLLVAGFRAGVGPELWTLDKKLSRALTTTAINGLIFCMRRMIADGKCSAEFDYYRQGFAKLTVDFRPAKFGFRSSRWRALGEKLYRQCFT